MFLVSNYYHMRCTILFLWQSNLIYAAKTLYLDSFTAKCVDLIYRRYFIALTN